MSIGLSDRKKKHDAVEYFTPPTDSPESLLLELTITDAEIVRELLAFADGRPREEYAVQALRIGVLALKQARGQLDAETIQRESERMLAGLEQKLSEHGQAVQMHLTNALKEYFDPESGRFQERVQRLVKKDGELEEVLRRLVGGQESELARTLTGFVGAQSPLMKMLSPNESEGLLKSLTEAHNTAMLEQREKILAQFSLDNKDGALTRLISELTDHHGKLTDKLQIQIDGVVKEFSLDSDDSALSRLVSRVDEARSKISSEFSLDNQGSALARLKTELLGTLQAHFETNIKFQQEVQATLAAIQARREAAARSTLHGLDFEGQVCDYLQSESQRVGDIASLTGTCTGMIRNCKIGDMVIELGPDSAAAGARIVIEATEEMGYSLPSAREELDKARKNRDAAVGLFIFSKKSAPTGLDFLRCENDVFVAWDAEDSQSDIILRAGLSVARALCIRQSTQRAAQQADFTAIDKAILEIEKQTSLLEEVTTLTDTIRSNGQKILNRVRISRESLADQIEVLREKIADLKA